MAVSKEQTPETNRIHPRGSVQPWGDIPLIDMVPKEYRRQVQEVLDADPNACRILEHCRSGSIDCWEALALLGIAQLDASKKPEERFRTLFDRVTEELSLTYREGTRAYIGECHPELLEELQKTDDRMIAAWSLRDWPVFEKALDHWRGIHEEMIHLFAHEGKHGSN